ncbi:hypothetical protein F511_34167 [Dorcoceras hygrometricum]|uniref:Uncharacterized protein n=1 Tax=Dorcoceras hygrometricum TaxID=472368 RepID=A0A2Z7DEN2_9LAMI|nr:hypothetical protein F511_34167 [Dorcoceras hygrometricum]
MTSTLLIERNQESAVDKKRKSWIIDDEVSNDVSYQQRATVQPAVVTSYSAPSRRLQRVATSRQRIQSRATMDLVAGYSALHIQSTGNLDAKKLQRIEPVAIEETIIASYSAPSRRLQRVATSRQRIQSRATMDLVAGYNALHIQSIGNLDAKKLRRIEPVAIEETISSEAVDGLHYEDSLKLDTMAMRESKDLNNMELHDLFANLKAYEFELETRAESEPSTSQPTGALASTILEKSPCSTSDRSAEDMSKDAMSLFFKKFEIYETKAGCEEATRSQNQQGEEGDENLSERKNGEKMVDKRIKVHGLTQIQKNLALKHPHPAKAKIKYNVLWLMTLMSMVKPVEAQSCETKIAAKPPIWQGIFCGWGTLLVKSLVKSDLTKELNRCGVNTNLMVEIKASFSTSMKDRQYRPQYHKPRSQVQHAAYQTPIRTKHTHGPHKLFDAHTGK